MGSPVIRACSGFTLGFRYRHRLAALLDATPPHRQITDIDLQSLKREGVEAVALDFDGVLAAHGASEPLSEASEWLQCCVEVFGADRVFILSNKPTSQRKEWFTAQFPGICFISGVRKKPYPDGINKTGELAGVPPSQILMVDDRLLTGCLAALLAGARPCYIMQPYTSFTHNPAAELFFELLRRVERLYIRMVSCC